MVLFVICFSEIMNEKRYFLSWIKFKDIFLLNWISDFQLKINI